MKHILATAVEQFLNRSGGSPLWCSATRLRVQPVGREGALAEGSPAEGHREACPTPFGFTNRTWCPMTGWQ
jgi:hypothetical protein